MRRSFLFPTMLLLSFLLGGCDRRVPVVKEPGEPTKTAQPEVAKPKMVPTIQSSHNLNLSDSYQPDPARPEERFSVPAEKRNAE